MARLSERHQPDFILMVTIAILCAIGVVTVYSASAPSALNLNLPASHFAVRQLIAVAIGMGLMFTLTRLPYRVGYRLAPLLMLINLGLLIVVLIPHIGIKAQGGRRWLGVGTHTFQPSEFTLLITTLYLAFFFTKQLAVLHQFRRGVLPALVIIGLNFGLIFLEPDMGTALTVFGVALMIVIASGARLRHIAASLACVVPIITGLAMTSYRFRRLLAFIHPFSPKNATTAWQLLQGLTGITAGGWFGRGFGMSIEKTGYLPYPYTDFIFPVFVEEWGVVGAAALLVIFGVLIWRGFHIAHHARDRFGAVLAVGLTGIVTVGLFINLGAVTGLLPVTGIPLPFISYGGTSLVISLASMGILLSISRDTLEQAPQSDELADVIEVETAREAATRQREPALPAPRTRRRAADVEPLRPRRKQAETVGNWRARQEAHVQSETRRTARSESARPARSAPAATKSRSGSTGRAPGGRQRKEAVPAQSARTWRERSNASTTSRSRKDATASSSARKGLFRKDR